MPAAHQRGKLQGCAALQEEQIVPGGKGALEVTAVLVVLDGAVVVLDGAKAQAA